MNESDFDPERLLLEANLREFGHTVGLICALLAGGKVSADEAYQLLQKHWADLEQSHNKLLQSR